ncbi:MAG TPA: hypothetical protein VGX72_13880 [Solirubrobacteraceae bacterium]|nr:hypothetical protein [Solirubrobacteraceae bacterium]
MNLISTLLTIVVLESGGPLHHHAQATGITNSTISVFRYAGTEKRPYAVLYEGGELTLRLQPGLYGVEVHLNNGGGPCQSARLRIGRRKTERVQLSCSVK